MKIKNRNGNVIFTAEAADLSGANLRDTNLRGADLSGADKFKTKFGVNV